MKEVAGEHHTAWLGNGIAVATQLPGRSFGALLMLVLRIHVVLLAVHEQGR